MRTWARFRWASGHLRVVLKPAVIFQFWFTMIFVVSLVPASGWLLNRLVARSGQFAVSDHDMLAFLFSAPA